MDFFKLSIKMGIWKSQKQSTIMDKQVNERRPLFMISL